MFLSALTEKIFVETDNVERPTEDGFDSARCTLPEYKWLEIRGYSDEEVEMFEKLLHSNAHLIFKYAANGGIQIA